MSSEVNTESSYSIKVAPAVATFGLSKQQREVIKHICTLGSNKAVAHAMNITENTIKVHVRSILKILKIQNRTLLAVWAVRNGLDV